MVCFFSEHGVEEGLAGWFLAAAEGLDCDKDRVNFCQLFGIIAPQCPTPAGFWATRLATSMFSITFRSIWKGNLYSTEVNDNFAAGECCRRIQKFILKGMSPAPAE